MPGSGGGADVHGSGRDVDVAVTDHENSIRDVVQYNSSTNTTSVTRHTFYTAFGWNFGTSPLLFGYTGRYTENFSTFLQWNGERWYNSFIGKWMPQDPIGFNGDPSNLYRYVGNSPTNGTDPSGLAQDPTDAPHGYYRGPHGGLHPLPPGANPNGHSGLNAPDYGWDDAFNNSPTAQIAAVVGITAAELAIGCDITGYNPILWGGPPPVLPTPPLPPWFNSPPINGPWGLGA